MLMNWGVYLTDQRAMKGGQGVNSELWPSPVSTVNKVNINTVRSLLKNDQIIFNQDWNTMPINNNNTVSIVCDAVNVFHFGFISEMLKI